MSDPLDPAVIAEVSTRLRQVDRTMTPAQAAHRLCVLADVLLTSTKPQREIFLMAIVAASLGAAACAARDAASPTAEAPFRSGTHG